MIHFFLALSAIVLGLAVLVVIRVLLDGDPLVERRCPTCGEPVVRTVSLGRVIDMRERHWGHNFEVLDAVKHKIAGWCTPTPESGDILRTKEGDLVLSSVEYENSPPEMWLARAHYINRSES